MGTINELGMVSARLDKTSDELLGVDTELGWTMDELLGDSVDAVLDSITHPKFGNAFEMEETTSDIETVVGSELGLIPIGNSSFHKEVSWQWLAICAGWYAIRGNLRSGHTRLPKKVSYTMY